MISLPMLASNSGVEAEVVSEGVIKATGQSGTIVMPKITKVTGGTPGFTLNGVIADTVKVTEILTNGAMGDEIQRSGGTASATQYALADGTFTAPTDTTKSYLVRYDREVENGAKVSNSADKFPNTIRLILKCLAVDPCEAGVLKAMYLELPSFQPSPEITVGLQTDTTLDYSGDLQVDYCSDDKGYYGSVA